MRYVSIGMIAKAAGKAPTTVARAIRLTGTPVEKLPGIAYPRLTLANANRLISRQWPESQQIA